MKNSVIKFSSLLFLLSFLFSSCAKTDKPLADQYSPSSQASSTISEENESLQPRQSAIEIIPLKQLEDIRIELSKYMKEYNIATIDANEVTNKIDIELYEDNPKIYELTDKYISREYVNVTVLPKGTALKFSVKECNPSDKTSSGSPSESVTDSDTVDVKIFHTAENKAISIDSKSAVAIKETVLSYPVLKKIFEGNKEYTITIDGNEYYYDSVTGELGNNGIKYLEDDEKKQFEALLK